MKHRRSLAGLAAVGAIVLAACASGGGGASTGGNAGTGGGAAAGGSTSGTITLGEVTDFTGVASTYGVPENQGAQIAADEINAAGGIKSLGGAKLQIQKFDTQSNPDQGVTQATAAVAAKIAAVFGGEISDTVLGGTNVTQRAGIPWIDTGGVADEVHKRGYSTVFQGIEDNTQEAESYHAFIGFAAKQLGIADPTVAISYSQASYGQEFLQAWQAANVNPTYKVVSSFGYPLTTTDFSSVAARMASSNADILFNMGYPADGLELTQEFSAKYHTSAKLWLASGANYVAVVSQLGAKSNGTIMGYVPAPGMPGLPAGFTQAYQEYKKKFNTDPNSQSWSGYTAVYFLAAALEKAKSTAGPALTAALKQVTLTHGHGNPYPVPAVLKFGQDNTLVEAPGYYTQVQNGASVLVYPSIADAAKLLPYAG